MSLDNLVGISLEKVTPDAAIIARLLSAAERNIADAHVKEISTENRFDAAYKAIMQLANAALQANGFRTLTSRPGHHMTMIQTLSQTVGVDKQLVIVLDALRKQRNVADYSGDTVPASAMEECVSYAETLRNAVVGWLKENKAELLRNKEE
ncbi:MAG: DNA-binding protein [Gammaproteobacteria bacterium]|nr:DNA-binding protein [Gammaproteobacteria bacterium]MDZ7751724.1 DNA-binding protein [Gammaproteobacteria bacterium]